MLHATSSTPRRKRAKERPESDAAFPFLFEKNPLPLWVYDLETLRFLDVNEVARKKYGYTRAIPRTDDSGHPTRRRHSTRQRFGARDAAGSLELRHLAPSQERRNVDLCRNSFARGRLRG